MPRHSWRWYFLTLSVLGLAALIIPIVYNLNLQLKPEELAQARERWRQHGPADYDLEYGVRIDGVKEPTVYRVEVREGKVVSATADWHPCQPGDPMVLSVDGMFERIEQSLQEDQKAEANSTSWRRGVYATAYFDASLGYPVRYIRRVTRSQQRPKPRLEWGVRLRPPGTFREEWSEASRPK